MGNDKGIKPCVYCDDEMPIIDLLDLPIKLPLMGIWESCTERIGHIHAVSQKAIAQYENVTEIDWGSA